jgi:hypothetical protein
MVSALFYNQPPTTRYQQTMTRMTLYRTALFILALLLFCALVSCAAESNKKVSKGSESSDTSSAAKPAGGWSRERPMRLLLGGSEARDSAAIITEMFVDQAIRQAADSIPSAKFLTLNYRDSLAGIAVKEGKKGIDIRVLGKDLNLDGVIFTRFARFSSVLALEMRIIDPESGGVLYRDIEFSMIRYRDTSGTMLLAPALYDGVRKALGKYFAVEHRADAPVATEPLLIGSVIIDEPDLGRLYKSRDPISESGVRALGEYARLHYPELVAFDYQSRNEIYRTVGVGAVENYMPVTELEKHSLFNIGIDRYVTASARMNGRDSVLVRLEIRSIVSPSRDTLVDAEQAVMPRDSLQTSTLERDFVIRLIDLSEVLYQREGERVRNAYERHSSEARKP